MAGEHFSASPAELTAGAGQVHGLVGTARSLSEQLSQTLAGMAGAAGHAGMAAALGRATDAASSSMLGAGAVLQHIGDGLSASATAYAETDAKHAAELSRLGSAVCAVWK